MNYKIWDKTSDIYTAGVDKATGKTRWAAEEYIQHKAQWAGHPAAKVVVADGIINGLLFADFDTMVSQYLRMGLQVPEGATDTEILALMSEIDANPPAPEPTAEERIATALELDNIMKYM